MRPRPLAEGLARLATASLFLAALGGFLLPLSVAWAAPASGFAAEPPSYRFRVFLGGGEPARWTGALSLTAGALSDLQLLGEGYDAPVHAHLADGKVAIHPPRDAARIGFDVTVSAPADAELVIDLLPGAGGAPFRRRVAVAELIASPLRQSIGESGAALLVHRAAADSIRVSIEGDRRVFAPGDEMKVDAALVLPNLPTGAPLNLQAELLSGRSGPRVWASPVERLTKPASTAATRQFAIPLPREAGVYSVRLAVSQPPGSVEAWLPGRTGALLADRTFQIVVDDPDESIGRPADWQTVYELDPTVSRWWDRLPRRVWRRRAAWLPEGPLGVGGAEVVQADNGRFIELPAADGDGSPWQAYPLHVQQPGAPHLVEIEYPANAPQQLVAAVFDTDQRGTAAPLGDGALASVGRWHSKSAAPRTVRGVFWPRTNSPLLVVANGTTDRPVRFGRLRVKQLSRREPAASTPSIDRVEHLVRIGEVDLPGMFAADRRGEFAYDDFVTYRQTARRLADALGAHRGAGAVVNVASAAGAIYPSRVFGHQPGRDRELILTGATDVPRKDGLELILREFDRRGLSVYPTLRFDGVLPGCVDAAQPASATQLELTDAARQQIRLAVAELVDRYGDHDALVGVAIDLSGHGYLSLPADPDAVGPWVELIGELAETVAAGGQGRDLIIIPNVVNDGEASKELLPLLGDRKATPAVDALTELRARAASQPALRVLTPRYAVGLAPVWAEAAMLEANRRSVAASAGATPMVVLPRRRVTLRDFEQVSPFGAKQTRGVIDVTPIGAAAADAYEQGSRRPGYASIVQSGGAAWEVLNGPTAGKNASRTAGMQPADIGRGQSVAVHTKQANDQTVITLSSSSPWPCEATVTARTAAACVASGEGAGQPGPLSFGKGEHLLTADLPPYGFARYMFDSPDVTPVGLRTKDAAVAKGQLAAELANLRRRNLAAESPFAGGPSASFESDSPGGTIEDWGAVPRGASGVTLTSESPADGQQAVRLTSSGPGVGVQSLGFPASRTGQLAVVFRVRAADIQPTSELRVVFEQTAGGYRSFTVMGAPQLETAEQWRSFAFPVNDLPLGRETNLRLRFELAGGGQVDIDHLQMYDLTFPLGFLGSSSAKQRLELLKPIQAAENALANGRLEDCRRVLDGYWPRFVATHVPAAAPVTEVAEQPTPPSEADDDKPKEQPRTAFGDRVRGYLPFFR
ncbi:MAG: hypothetical protein AAGJ46_09580 [Planctomycetota bacterium]